jgi:phenylalanyl-tRNA synthetase beta chain
MKVTLNWLKQYVDFDWSPEELGERLTMLGIEVEGVEKLGGEFQGIVVAQVITRDKHSNADKLSVCRVNDGQGERQIVCGADNFKAGDKVPLILPGATLPAKPGVEPFTIKVGKIRGVESHGMMCSPQELGLPDSVNGLLILREDAIVGQPFSQYLGRSGNDVIYDLEITPNRPDLNSIIGIAREISALTGNPLRFPEVKLPALAPRHAKDLVAVRIEDPEFCPRYTARVVLGVKVGPSPNWLRESLEKLGVRSINNVVDVTNYVMLEVGQPLHAFDFHLLNQAANQQLPAIIVRHAGEGEKFSTLDGQARTLSSKMLLIADETKPLAIAGVMGGQNSEIQPTTVDVLVESAYFKPQSIRATSKKLELRTESSYRFERGCDVGICDWASERAVQLIIETAGGRAAEGIVDVCPLPVECKQVSLRPDRANALLGLNLSPQEMEAYLGALELRPASRKPRAVGAQETDSGPLTFRIPTFRVDLKREIDLVEEIARLYGVDRIPATPPRGAIGANAYDSIHDQIAEARRVLSGLGLSETQGQTLVAGSSAQLTTSPEGLVPLSNPLSSDMDVLRPSLLPGLLDALQRNLSRNNLNLAFFEVGRVFIKATGQGQAATVREERHVAIALTGQRNALFWSGDDREAKFDIFDLKGLLEEFFDQYGVRGVAWNRRPDSTQIFLESATVNLGKFTLGELGQLLPGLAKRYDLRDPVLLAELNLDQLLARRNTGKSLKALPAFPAVRRDVAMLVPESVTHDAVLAAVKQAKPANLEAVELFDIFRGKNVPSGHKSMAYAFTYRSAEKTLVDAEVNSAQEKLVEVLKKQLQASVRE